MRLRLRPLPLRWLLTFSIFALILPALLLTIHLSQRNGNAQIESYHRQFLHHQLANLQIEVSEHLDENDVVGIGRHRVAQIDVQGMGAGREGVAHALAAPWS